MPHRHDLGAQNGRENETQTMQNIKAQAIMAHSPDHNTHAISCMSQEPETTMRVCVDAKIGNSVRLLYVVVRAHASLIQALQDSLGHKSAEPLVLKITS